MPSETKIKIIDRKVLVGEIYCKVRVHVDISRSWELLFD